MPSKETKMSFPRLCAGGVCGHSSWDQRFGASEVGAVSGLQECFNVGSTEETLFLNVGLCLYSSKTVFYQRQDFTGLLNFHRIGLDYFLCLLFYFLYIIDRKIFLKKTNNEYSQW